MNRRAFLGLLTAGVASAQLRPEQQALKNDFVDHINAFERKFNLVLDDVIDNKWDMKLAEETVAAFYELIQHPMWMMRDKGKK